MLSSLSIGSIDNLEKLPINSLNSICDRVRQALLHVFLPRLCEKCRPTFSEAFRKTQSTPLLLKALCEPCKINYVKDKRSVSRKKVTKPEKSENHQTTCPNENTPDNLLTTTALEKLPAKRKQKTEFSRSLNSLTDDGSSKQKQNTQESFGKLKLKIKLISATKLSDEVTSNICLKVNDSIGYTTSTAMPSTKSITDIPSATTTTTTTATTNTNTTVTPLNLDTKPLASNPINHPLPLTPPPTDDDNDHLCKVQVQLLDDNVTILIDNSQKTVSYCQVYEYFNQKGVDWCRYCGVAGDTGTFWKLGPWGDRTLCHKHGCEFFGCGFARVTKTRLDLTKFYNEKRSDRLKPIVSEYCSSCWLKLEHDDEKALFCYGCPLAYHKSCFNNNNHLINDSPFYCTQNCHENFEKCLIRPQFHSKSSFPFYRQILTVESSISASNNNSSSSSTNYDENNFKIRLQIPNKKPVVDVTLTKKRKYNHRKQNENQVDRIIAFLPIKVDQTVHQHENIKTPQWTKKSLQERLNQPQHIPSEYHFEELDDLVLLNRHSRYEHVEKTTRLLKPGVLKQLISGGQL